MPAYHARIALEAHEVTTGALIVNVLHAEVDTLTSPPDWASIATDVASWLGIQWRNILTSNDSFDQVVVTDENYPGSTHGQGVLPEQLIGSRVAADHKLDPAICAVATYKTAVAKRYARGHQFFPPARDSAALADPAGWLSTNAYIVACKAFVTQFLAGHVAGSTSYIPEVFSKHLVTTGVAPFANHILTGAVGTKQHFLRSRSTAP